MYLCAIKIWTIPDYCHNAFGSFKQTFFVITSESVRFQVVISVIIQYAACQLILVK